MRFEPKRHLIKVQGGRMYLPVSARLIWFRSEHPDWGIETETIALDLERQYAIFRAKIYDADGKLMATGTKYEDVRGFPDYVEKAETGSVGRALALCGYGTQFAPELDEVDMRQTAPPRLASPGRFVDSPQAGAGDAMPANGRVCGSCGKSLTGSQQELSIRHYGEALCPACQRDRARQAVPGVPPQTNGGAA